MGHRVCSLNLGRGEETLLKEDRGAETVGGGEGVSQVGYGVGTVQAEAWLLRRHQCGRMPVCLARVAGE